MLLYDVIFLVNFYSLFNLTIMNYKIILLLSIASTFLLSESSAQFVTDPANTTNIYNTSLTGKVGIGVIPIPDGMAGPYPNLSPTLQIKGPSGTTGGTASIVLPVVKIASTTYTNTIGIGINRVNWPTVYEYAFLNTENRLQIQSPEFEVVGTSYLKSKVIIGSNAPTSPIATPGNYRLYVTGGILTEKIKVAVSTDAVNWSDFVFAKDYKLRSLSEVESYVKKHHHLPEIPSSEEIYKDGLDLAQMDAKLLMKIEELTLYMIELKKENEKLKSQIDILINKIK